MLAPRRALIIEMGIGLFLLLGAATASGDDWPLSRHDERRSGATSQTLPAELHLQWTRELPPLVPAWPDQPRVQFDAVYDPIVVGSTLFLASSRHDTVTAYDTRSGAEKWTFHADGPIRFAPAAWEGRLYVVSDDGFLYCLDAALGSLHWKFRGAPADRRILGNERLISTWPARGAPVIADGTVYFAAGIWPFMGTFIHALDASTGRPVWINDGDGSVYIKQPHNTDSFGGVAPQGAMVIAGDKLLIPGGRSMPACYDRATGKGVYFQWAIPEHSRRGGPDVAVGGGFFFNGEAGFDLVTGNLMGEVGSPLVVAEEGLYFASKTGDLVFLKAPRMETVETADKNGKVTKKIRWAVGQRETLGVSWVSALVKAGNRVYAGSEKSLVAVDPSAPGKVVWKTGLPEPAARLIAADDRLFAVSREGRISCFGGEKTEPVAHPWRPVETPLPEMAVARAKAVLESAGVREGYAVLWGLGPDGFLEALVRAGMLRIVALDPDPARVEAARKRIIAAGLYGVRASVHAGDPSTVTLPPYFASLVLCEDLEAAGWGEGDRFAAAAFATLRPYGGMLSVAGREEQRRAVVRWAAFERPEEAVTRESYDRVVLARPGPLPGAGDWTHEHADAANTRVSRDRRVRAPLGLLWFGGSSNAGILPRHGHGPQPQVIDGRLIIEGMNLLRAMDIYTGRVLWEATLPGVGSFYNNVLHQPGANASGTNFISCSDGIYVINGKACLRLDPATGSKVSEFSLPDGAAWGYLNVVDDLLVGGAEPLMGATLVSTDPKAGFDDPRGADAAAAELIKKLSALKGDSDNLSSSRRLVVMDRHTGKVAWTASSVNGFRHNALCAGSGRLFAIDRLSGPQVDRLKRRGETPKTPARLTAFDLRTGKILWSTEQDVFGTWLSYSARCDILVEAGRYARDTIKDEPKGMRAYRGGDGKLLWQGTQVGPAMINGDTILLAEKACDLRTGAPRLRPHPFTGEPVEWTWTRNHGCNTPAASEHLMTFRSGAAGYFDLAGDGGTGNFGGFRSSCTNNLVLAGGLLTAPDYTRTCICAYQNQTSLALVPMPEAEMWTFFGPAPDAKGPLQKVGINLGAPGDRRAPDGTYWVEFPSVAGKSPNVSVSLSPDKPQWFRHNAARIAGPGIPWVAASGAKGLKSATVNLEKDGKVERSYTIRLHFVEPDGLAAGARVFDVTLQGKKVLADFDIAKEAGGPDRALVKEFRDVRVKKDLKISFEPSRSVPDSASVLCGIEAVATCNVPVFRYALERWRSAPYELFLYHRGPLKDEDRKALAPLERAENGEEGAAANLAIERVDLERKTSKPPGPPLLRPKDEELPLLALVYPSETDLQQTIWTGPLKAGTAEKILESPARREIVRRILQGDSVVWVLVESGSKEKDDAAAALLDARLKVLQETLKLPALTDDPADRLRAAEAVPLKLAFSALRISRDDSAEEFFLKMLLRSEKGLEEKRESMVFPVFGRGRMLEALVGAGINDENLGDYATFLTGPCSCEAKLQNPGIDLLIAADWPALFEGKPLPPVILPVRPLSELGPVETDPPLPPLLPERRLLWGGTALAALLVFWTGLRLFRRPKLESR